MYEAFEPFEDREADAAYPREEASSATDECEKLSESSSVEVKSRCSSVPAIRTALPRLKLSEDVVEAACAWANESGPVGVGGCDDELPEEEDEESIEGLRRWERGGVTSDERRLLVPGVTGEGGQTDACCAW